MKIKLILLVSVPMTILLASGFARANVACVSQQNCGECMKIKGCSWCKSPSEKFQTPVRCNTKRELIEKGCEENNIVNYQSSASTVENEELSDAGALAGHAIQIKPQQMKMSLRPNHPQKFNLIFRQSEDYPVDLYYLMDLTANMRHHKEKLAKLGDRLAASMINITKNFRLGFGSFVDKVVMPYANMMPKKLINPCTEELKCRSPYGYQNHLPLSSNVSRFVEEVDAAEFSGNLDDAEGGLDAIMQAIVCQEYLNWNERSRKIILFATGSTFHIAGDGKLGGIVKPNDGHCHMNKAGYYTETVHQDYPSLSQINTTIGEYKVSIMFAVPNQQMTVYKRMSQVLQGSSVAQLAKDSSNIVQLVANQYNKISSEVRLIDNAPPGVYIKYSSKCLGNKMKETNFCEGLKVGTTVEFEVEIELKSCTNVTIGRKPMMIHPFGFQDNLKIDLALKCQCECEKDLPKTNSPDCTNGQGIKVCGSCQCLDNFYGKDCECSGGEEAIEFNIEKCKMTNTSKVCSGKGLCHCGVCECFKSEQSEEVIYGEFCECDNLACPSDSGGNICGGNNRGSCGCDGLCTCINGWSGNVCDCGSSDQCVDPKASKQVHCNKHGNCECGTCVCNSNENGLSYTGTYCQDVVQRCELYTECVKCQVHDKSSPLPLECSNCSFVPVILETISTVEDNETRCQVEYDEDCVFLFAYSYDVILHQAHVRAQKTKICRGEVEPLHVVLGVAAGVFFIGLTIVLIIRFCMYLRDKREYQAHLKQVADTDWNKATHNPLHVPPKTEYKNPIFESKS